MRTYATAQLTGNRAHQCDATAVYTAPNGARAYVLLDGIGRSEPIRDWTRAAARRIARAAARSADAEAGLRRVYNGYAADPFSFKACAVVAVTAPGKPLTVAWCGDARAYLLTSGTLRPLTQDHNLRRIYPPVEGVHDGGNRNVVTSCLGSTATDEELRNEVGHPAIETATVHVTRARLVLASDGAYEPHHDAEHHLSDHLVGDPAEAARHFVKTAVATALAADRADPYADNSTVLVADLR